LLATAVLLPAVATAQRAAQSQPFNYSYVELRYDESDFRVGPADIDGDGISLEGSFELTDDWHLVASYGAADLDNGIDVDTWAFGVGYRHPLKSNVDLYGRVLYIDSEADLPGPGGGPDEDGLGLQLRIRALVNDDLEVEGGIQHIDLGDSDTSLQAGIRYHFNDKLSAGLGVTFAGDTDGIGINARFAF
jgi:hypothetical protein